MYSYTETYTVTLKCTCSAPTHTLLVRAGNNLYKSPVPNSHVTEEETAAQVLTVSQGHRQDRNAGLLDSGPGFCLTRTRHRASVREGPPGRGSPLCGQIPAPTRTSDTSQEKTNMSLLSPSPSFLYNGGVGSERAKARSPRWKFSGKHGAK